MVLGSILTELNSQTFSFFATELFCGRYDSINFDVRFQTQTKSKGAGAVSRGIFILPVSSGILMVEKSSCSRDVAEPVKQGKPGRRYVGRVLPADSRFS
jgi:hypothetical protein